MMSPCRAGGATEAEPVDTVSPTTAWVAVGLNNETKTLDFPSVDPVAMYEVGDVPTAQGDSSGAAVIVGSGDEALLPAPPPAWEAAGVPESFATLVWSQAEAQVRGETSQDAWETRRHAQDNRAGKTSIDERSRSSYFESAFSDALAIYMLSLAVDFDYHDLRERDYPLLAATALAERLRHVASLFPANQGYEFQVLYRRKG